ncbi:hypothetical protein HGRIS_010791 [Hohenbuehelia grisea]|uniref:Uncharacterized protein n=1 Tax=Hohenbuehelia grisea TaxID=104357 RepID=A0ABR3IYA7_9AGAR
MSCMQRRCFSARVQQYVQRPKTKGKTGFMKGPHQHSQDHTPEEVVRIIARRIAKAERDERVDMTLALTPVRTYMAGFTRPRDLRINNWLPGGAYVEKEKSYESPPEAAYEPHTIFLVETRYPVVHGVGRPDCPDHMVGICREGDYAAVMKKINSVRAGRVSREYKEAMDNARWPWRPQRNIKKTKWWEPGESPRAIIRQAYSGEDTNNPEEGVGTGEDVVEGEVETTPESGASQDKPLPDAISGSEANTTQRRIPPEHKEPVIHAPPFPPLSSSDAESSAESTSPISSPLETPLSSKGASSKPPPSQSSSKPQISPTQPTPIPPPTLTLESQVADEGADDEPSEAPSNVPHSLDYREELNKEPFWRPLLTVTLPTRTLAHTLTRLSRSLPRGLPFYASIPSNDRKMPLTFAGQMRCMRISRFQQLITETAELLAGARGGFLGIRFSPNDRGRGVNGEGLATSIPHDKRLIHIGVGDWYSLGHEVKEYFRMTQEENVYLSGRSDGPAFKLYNLDESWRRLDDDTGEVVPWTPTKPFALPECIEELRALANDLRIGNGQDPLLSTVEEEVSDEDENTDSPEHETKDDDAPSYKKLGPRAAVATITRADLPHTPINSEHEDNEWRRQIKARRQEIARKYSRELAAFKCQAANSVIYP